MQKRSALTAALSGAPAAPAAAPAAKAPAHATGVSLDNYAFPCLAFATEDGSPRMSEDTVEDIVQDLSSITIVGSAPTSTSLGNTALVGAAGAPC